MACFARCLVHQNVENFFDRHEVSIAIFRFWGKWLKESHANTAVWSVTKETKICGEVVKY